MTKSQNKKRQLARSIRLRVFERDQWRCWFCGIQTELVYRDDLSNPISATLEHLSPESLGGSNDESNLVTACKRCNSQKKNRTIEGYRAYLRYSLTDQGRAILHLQAGLLSASTPFDSSIQQAIDWLENNLQPIIFHGESKTDVH